jgi:hypothetical protein
LRRVSGLQELPAAIWHHFVTDVPATAPITKSCMACDKFALEDPVALAEDYLSNDLLVHFAD